MPIANVDGLRISYSDTGAGLPIVFVPGLAGSKEWFRYQASGLSDRYRVISYDLRHARGRAGCSLDLLAGDLGGLLDSLRVNGAVIAGHALGGMVALRFAVDRPDRCLAVIATSCAPVFADMPDDELLAYFSVGEVKLDGFFAGLWKRLLGRKPVKKTEADPTSQLALCSCDVDQATISARLRAMRECDLTPVLGQVVVPTLIITGANDRPVILAGSQLMDQRIPDSALEVIEDAGHFAFYTRHDLFNAAVHEYLTRKVAYL